MLQLSPHKRPLKAVDAWPNITSKPGDRVIGQRAVPSALLACYLEGWAETNLTKMIAATAPGYRLYDPLVGSFPSRSLQGYFYALQDRLSSGGIVTQQDVAFFLSGPMDQRSCPGQLQFWREAPRVGLVGVSEIEFGEHGVIAESVAYDLNMASNMLRRFGDQAPLHVSRRNDSAD
jgi:hypothetical protein